VRVLCQHCREAFEPLASFVERMQLQKLAGERSITLFRPRGCSQCNGTGFWGRTVILEILVVTDTVRNLVLQKAEARRLKECAIAEGMLTMHVHGMRKVLSGITTIEEVLRVARDF